MRTRCVLNALLLAAVPPFLPAGVGLAAPPPDATAYHRVNLDAGANHLLEGDNPYVRKGERVCWVPDAAFRSPPVLEARALDHLLLAALVRRGVEFVDHEDKADVLLAVSFAEVRDEPYFRPELLGMRPGPAYRLRDRVAVRAVERASGRIRGENYLVVEFKPFDGALAPGSSEATGSAAQPMPDLGSVQSDLTGYGLAVSWLSGSGFAWRRWFASGWGWQVAGIPYSDGSAYFHNVGAQVMRQMVDGRLGRMYLLGATGVAYGTAGPTGWYRRGSDGISWTRQPSLLWNLSAGLGADFRLTPNLVLAFGAGYSLGPQATYDDLSNDRIETLGVTPAFSFGSFLEF